MKKFARQKHEGQTLILIALMMVGLIAMVALVVDGGNAFVQRRNAQNAADGAATSGGAMLKQFYLSSVYSDTLAYPPVQKALPLTTTQDDQVLAAIVTTLAAQGADTVSVSSGGTMDARYLDKDGHVIGSRVGSNTSSLAWAGGDGNPSSNGVSGVWVNTTSRAQTFFARLIGVNTVQADAHGSMQLRLQYGTGTARASLAPGCAASASSSISSNFNSSTLNAGTTIWFNSILRVSGVGWTGATIYMVGGTIRFSAGGQNYTITAPDATITMRYGAAASTSFNSSSNTWETTLPTSWSGDAFLSGVGVYLPYSLPGGITNVTWSAGFATDRSGVSLSWRWSAAAYTTFSGDNNALNVIPLDTWTTTAAVPYTYRGYVVSGARGSGGTNYTGSYTSSASVSPCTAAPITLPPSDAEVDLNLK